MSDQEQFEAWFAKEIYGKVTDLSTHQAAKLGWQACLEAAKLSRLDKENLEIGRQLQRAANDLPDLFNIEIDVENGCASVTLINEDGNRQSFILDEHLSDTISDAIDAAIKDGRKVTQEDCNEKPCSFCFSRDCNGTCISGLDN